MIGVQKESFTIVLDREHIDLIVRDFGLTTVQEFGDTAKHIAKQVGLKDGDWQLGCMFKEDIEYMVSFLTNGTSTFEVMKVGGYV